ncbi:MAG: FadR/GntR family transcriptional regulator [Candidatus Pelethousia sp.]|nr:FadR/GntR family transcriptional regulator [Candidatus Pelethousia sp.]
MKQDLYAMGPADAPDEEANSLLRPMGNQSIVDRIIDRLINAILNGELQPGQQIPTETELCESMQVGRNSVREAVKTLVSMGVLYIRRAEGTFVADGFSERMLDPLIYGLILEGGSSPYMVELRRLFEVGILQLAVEKAEDADIANLHEALDDFRRVVEDNPDQSEILDADIRFHRALQLIVKNPLVDKISVVIEKLTRISRQRATAHFMNKGELASMVELHEKILETVATGNKEAAATVVEEHYKYWKEELN